MGQGKSTHNYHIPWYILIFRLELDDIISAKTPKHQFFTPKLRIGIFVPDQGGFVGDVTGDTRKRWTSTSSPSSLPITRSSQKRYSIHESGVIRNNVSSAMQCSISLFSIWNFNVVFVTPLRLFPCIYLKERQSCVYFEFTFDHMFRKKYLPKFIPEKTGLGWCMVVYGKHLVRISSPFFPEMGRYMADLQKNRQGLGWLSLLLFLAYLAE